MNNPLLEVNDIDVFYKDVQVLRQISLHVDRGEIVSVIGPNGTGKSTLLHSIVGFQNPKNGSIIFDGQSIHKLPTEKVIPLGLTSVPEGARVFADMTVLDNLKMGSYIKSARADRESSLEQVFHFFPRLEERKTEMAAP